MTDTLEPPVHATVLLSGWPNVLGGITVLALVTVAWKRAARSRPV